MNWIQADIFTTTAGIDPVSTQLIALGLSGFAIQDAQDFQDFLKDTTIHWDYVDEELMKLAQCETKTTLYLPDNLQGAEQLSGVKSMLRALKAQDTDHSYGRLDIELADIQGGEDWSTAWKKILPSGGNSPRLVACPPLGRTPLCVRDRPCSGWIRVWPFGFRRHP